MTVQIIQNISNWQEVADYTRNLLDRVGTAEQAFSALGRQQLWLRYEPDYKNGTYCDGIDDPRLWNFLKRLVPTADLAQVFGGNRSGHKFSPRRSLRKLYSFPTLFRKVNV